MDKNILVIDDDRDILESLKIMLTFHGYKVETLSKGAEAFHVKDPPGLILLDVWLSGENGVDICKRLKSDSSTADIPVILVSASKDLDKTAQEAMADGYLEKPFDMKNLLNIIEKHLVN